MSETGIDAPVHTVTEAQFLHIGRGETSHASEPRSRSAGDPYIDAERRAGDARMAHTRGFSKKSWKGNGFGHFVKSPFITLNDAFEKLPDDLGFNVEVKYPMLSEAQDEEMLASAVEPNVFVDKILKAVFDLAGDRKVVFSSFHPDLCIALVKKQRRYPVLFLSDAGAWPMADRRAQSLQEAVRHVKRWGLAGIVAAAEVFVLCPSLIRKVKREGLLCLSYGTENNDTELVKVCIQVVL
jgi:glycerophosphodiester phosphodiesterase